VEDWAVNQRGAGWLFGAEQVRHFLQLNGFVLIARSHQLAQQGFQWYFDQTLITVWSAPNYMYRAGNMASVMKLADGFEKAEDAHMEVFDAHPNGAERKPEDVMLGYFM
jgi:hypothetical protein